MTRLRHDERRVLDTLVDAGVARSRSDALAWCVRLVGEHTEEWLNQLRDAMGEGGNLARQGPSLCPRPVTAGNLISVLRQVTATRYVTPLREGGSLPGVGEAEHLGPDGGKVPGPGRGRRAGQGPKALVAEVIAGSLALRLGLPVPELVVVGLDPVVARAEPD